MSDNMSNKLSKSMDSDLEEQAENELFRKIQAKVELSLLIERKVKELERLKDEIALCRK